MKELKKEYIEQTAGFNPSQLSQVVAAVLFGSVLSSLFAGYLADKMGRKALITVAAALLTASIPVICLSQEVFGIMLLGRIRGAKAEYSWALMKLANVKLEFGVRTNSGRPSWILVI